MNKLTSSVSEIRFAAIEGKTIEPEIKSIIMNKFPYVKAETEIVEINASKLMLASGTEPEPVIPDAETC